MKKKSCRNKREMREGNFIGCGYGCCCLGLCLHSFLLLSASSASLFQHFDWLIDWLSLIDTQTFVYELAWLFTPSLAFPLTYLPLSFSSLSLYPSFCVVYACVPSHQCGLLYKPTASTVEQISCSWHGKWFTFSLSLFHSHRVFASRTGSCDPLCQWCCTWNFSTHMLWQ